MRCFVTGGGKQECHVPDEAKNDRICVKVGHELCSYFTVATLRLERDAAECKDGWKKGRASRIQRLFGSKCATGDTLRLWLPRRNAGRPARRSSRQRRKQPPGLPREKLLRKLPPNPGSSPAPGRRPYSGSGRAERQKSWTP